MQTSQAFVREVGAKYGIRAACAGSVNEATKDADVVVTTTPARSPIVMNQDIREGVHINAIGADAPGKEELDPMILKRAKIVIDNWEQSSHGGEINVPFSKGIIARKDIHGDIGEIVTGKKKGREKRFNSLIVGDQLIVEPTAKSAIPWRVIRNSLVCIPAKSCPAK